MMSRKNHVSSRPSFVSPPPSVGKGEARGTELDAALAHLRPQFKRLLPNWANKPDASVVKNKT